MTLHKTFFVQFINQDNHCAGKHTKHLSELLQTAICGCRNNPQYPRVLGRNSESSDPFGEALGGMRSELRQQKSRTGILRDFRRLRVSRSMRCKNTG
jgi:hypothetical protein